MQRLAVAGAGLARLARFHIDPDIDAGRLVPVLEDFNPGELEQIHAVFVGHGGQLPARCAHFSIIWSRTFGFDACKAGSNRAAMIADSALQISHRIKFLRVVAALQCSVTACDRRNVVRFENYSREPAKSKRWYD